MSPNPPSTLGKYQIIREIARSNDIVYEGYGTPPDIEVDMDPFLWRQGRDAQLERAIEEILKDLPNVKPVLQKRPEFPNKTKIGGSLG